MGVDEWLVSSWALELVHWICLQEEPPVNVFG